MKFDKIIMNPPYGGRGSGDLHLRILAEAMKHLSKEGICVNLSPIVWLEKYNVNRPFSKYRSIFNGLLKKLDIISHDMANDCFFTGNALSKLGIYMLKNDNSKCLDLMIHGFSSEIERSIFKKIDMMNKEMGILTFNKCIDEIYGTIKGIRRPHDVIVYTWHSGNSCREAVVRTDGKKASLILYFNTEEERANFLDSLDTTFMNFYWRSFVVPGDNKIMNYMFRMKDYTEPWTDERFYKLFGITEEEQKIIESTMEQFR